MKEETIKKLTLDHPEGDEETLAFLISDVTGLSINVFDSSGITVLGELSLDVALPFLKTVVQRMEEVHEKLEDTEAVKSLMSWAEWANRAFSCFGADDLDDHISRVNVTIRPVGCADVIIADVEWSHDSARNTLKCALKEINSQGHFAKTFIKVDYSNNISVVLAIDSVNERASVIVDEDSINELYSSRFERGELHRISEAVHVVREHVCI